MSGVCITASGNILASGNLCFTVFKLELKVINKHIYLFRIWGNQINYLIKPITYPLFLTNFPAIYGRSNIIYDLSLILQNQLSRDVLLKNALEKSVLQRCSKIKFCCSGQNPQQRTLFLCLGLTLHFWGRYSQITFRSKVIPKQPRKCPKN